MPKNSQLNRLRNTLLRMVKRVTKDKAWQILTKNAMGNYKMCTLTQKVRWIILITIEQPIAQLQSKKLKFEKRDREEKNNEKESIKRTACS